MREYRLSLASPFASPYECAQSKMSKCIIPSAKWDGKTGIGERLKRYYKDNPSALYTNREIAVEQREEMQSATLTPALEPIEDGKAVCSCCLRVLPIAAFSRDRHAESGHTARCKDCRNRQRRKLY